MEEILHGMIELQPSLKVVAFVCLLLWGFLKGLREAIATGSDILSIREKLSKYKKKKINEKADPIEGPPFFD